MRLEEEGRIREILEAFRERGFLLSPEALDLISRADRGEILSRLEEMDPRPTVVSAALVRSIVADLSGPGIGTGGGREGGEVIVEFDPVAEPVSGEVGDFVSLFVNRFEKLTPILRKRVGPSARVPSQITSADYGQEVTLIGMIRDKKRSSKNGFVLVLEDPGGQIPVYVPPDRRQLTGLVGSLLMDQVVAVRGVLSQRGTLVAEAIYRPDVGEREPSLSPREGESAVLISDVHAGSRYFLAEIMDEFLDWLRSGEARGVRYLVVCGDLVDGIGVYPSQEEELDVPDIYAQFELASEFLSKVPPDVSIVYVPGNHEPVRQAEPQPRVPDRYLGPVVRAHPKITVLGNPAVVRLSGVRFLLYHGRSLNAIFKYVPGLQPPTADSVIRAMAEYLKSRHLAPVYGEHPLMPGPEDLMVIERVPDVVHSGHVHVYGVGTYKNVRLVNSGTFQGATPYIRGLGIEPTPGLVPVVRLDTLEVRTLRFGG